MAQDDLVPDSALIARAEHLVQAVQQLRELAALRPHLGSPTEALGTAAFNLGAFVEAGRELAQPDDPINAKYRSRMRGVRFPTVSGIWFYPFDPKPDEIRHKDIVAGLANMCRFNGQLPRFYSVAEHSIKVAAVVEHLASEAVAEGVFSRDLVPLAALFGLMHDAHEAYTGDVLGPIKPLVADVYGTPWERVEDRVQDAIMEAYALPVMPVEVEGFVRDADAWVLYCEAITLKSASNLDEWDLRVPPPEVINIARVRRAEPNRASLRELFDGEMRRLVSLVEGRIPEDADVPTIIDPDSKRAQAAANLAEIMRDVPVPGERPPQHSAPPSKGEEFLPRLGRSPRDDDVSESSWRNAIQSATVDVPPAILDDVSGDADV